MPVYFIQEGFEGAIKIGSTTNLRKRFETLQTANSSLLHILGVIPGGQREERLLHHRFTPYRKRGEWYHPTPELLGYIRCRTSVELEEDDATEYDRFYQWQKALTQSLNE